MEYQGQHSMDDELDNRHPRLPLGRILRGAGAVGGVLAGTLLLSQCGEPGDDTLKSTAQKTSLAVPTPSVTSPDASPQDVLTFSLVSPSATESNTDDSRRAQPTASEIPSNDTTASSPSESPEAASSTPTQPDEDVTRTPLPSKSPIPLPTTYPSNCDPIRHIPRQTDDRPGLTIDGKQLPETDGLTTAETPGSTKDQYSVCVKPDNDITTAPHPKISLFTYPAPQ